MKHRSALGVQVILLIILGLCLFYLGKVGWTIFYPPTPTPSPTPPPTSTPTPTPTSTPTPSPTPSPLPTPTPSPTSTPTRPPTPTMTPSPTPTRGTARRSGAVLAFFDEDQAYTHVVTQVAFGPRIPGSRASARTRAYIRQQVEQWGWEVEEDAFTFRGVPLTNVLARKGKGPACILGAHYDTRPRADQDPRPERRNDPVPGANDGASGVAVLLELARILPVEEDDPAVWLYFFDGEDSGDINGWPWAVGARHAAKRVDPNHVRCVIVVDMVGDKDQAFYWENNSTPALRQSIWEMAEELGYDHIFVPESLNLSVIDDHLPFAKRNIPAVDIIDFEYPYWHTVDDTPDKVSPRSLGRVGEVLYNWYQISGTRYGLPDKGR